MQLVNLPPIPNILKSRVSIYFFSGEVRSAADLPFSHIIVMVFSSPATHYILKSTLGLENLI